MKGAMEFHNSFMLILTSSSKPPTYSFPALKWGLTCARWSGVWV